MKKQNVLVTGGVGFIGSHLVEALLKRDDVESVVIIDNLSMSDLSNIEHLKCSKLNFIQGDVADYNLVSFILNKHSVDTVFHLAVTPLVFSIKEPKAACDNIYGMEQVILECQRKGFFNKLVSFSTSEVYGSSESMVLNENDRLAPRTPYAAAKAASDLLVQSYSESFGIDYTIIRLFNNYGPRKKVFLRKAGIIPSTIYLLARNEAVNIFGDGNYSRDFVFVDDTVRATLLAWKSELCNNQTINIANSVTHSVISIVKDIAKIMKINEPKIDFLPNRDGDVSFLCGDGSKAKELIGFSPEVKWEDGLVKCVEYYSKLAKS